MRPKHPPKTSAYHLVRVTSCRRSIVIGGRSRGIEVPPLHAPPDPILLTGVGFSLQSAFGTDDPG